MHASLCAVILKENSSYKVCGLSRVTRKERTLLSFFLFLFFLNELSAISLHHTGKKGHISTADISKTLGVNCPFKCSNMQVTV